jgi:hypothetical protein
LEYGITTKLSIADSIRELYLYHYETTLDFGIQEGSIVLNDSDIDMKAELSIRFINNFHKKIHYIENQIRIRKQNKCLEPYIGKLVSCKIVSIGQNKTCVVNVIHTNLLIEANKFLRGDVFVIDKEYLFLVKENDDDILLIRNDKDYVLLAIMQYLTEYDTDKIVKVYRHPSYMNYIVVDSTDEQVKYYAQRYLNNLDFINEDIGYEKVRFISASTNAVYLYLDVLHVSTFNKKKHLLCSLNDKVLYLITDRLNIWKDTKTLDYMIGEIYNIDGVTVSILNLATDRNIIIEKLSQVLHISEKSLTKLINNMTQITDLHSLTMLKLQNYYYFTKNESENLILYLIDYYLYDYNEEIDIKKYVLNNDSCILNCLNKQNK